MFVILLVKIRCKKAIWNQNTGLRDNAALCLVSRPWFCNPAQYWRTAYFSLLYIQYSHCRTAHTDVMAHNGTTLTDKVIWIKGELHCYICVTDLEILLQDLYKGKKNIHSTFISIKWKEEVYTENCVAGKNTKMANNDQNNTNELFWVTWTLMTTLRNEPDL